MSNPRSRVPADQAINGEIFVVPKGVSVAACFCYRVGNRTCLCPFLKSGGVGCEGVGRGNNVQWHFHTMVMLRCSFRTAVGAHGGERKTACQGALMFISLTVGSVS